MVVVRENVWLFMNFINQIEALVEIEGVRVCFDEGLWIAYKKIQIAMSYWDKDESDLLLKVDFW